MSGNRVDPIRTRSMRKLQWHDPEEVLINLRYIELHLSPDTNEKIRRLRTHSLKEWREGREAALFAYGLGKKVLGHKVSVAKSEAMDYDCIIAWRTEDREYFYPVQLKELPPKDLNSEITLDSIYDKVETYRGETDLSVAIHVNRAMRLDYRPWDRPENPRINELWLFGCTSPDQNNWFIYGNVLHSQPQFREFDYPSGEPNFA